MERAGVAIPDQLPPKVLWSKPKTRGQDHAVQTLGRRDKKDQSQWGLQWGTSLLASGLTLLLDEVDQPIGGRIMRSHWAAAIKLRFNFLSQLLSQLHSPLVKAVDVPDDALYEDLVLVHGNQGSKDERRELGEHNRVGGAISFKDLVGQQFLKVLWTLPSGLQLLPGLFRRLPLH